MWSILFLPKLGGEDHLRKVKSLVERIRSLIKGHTKKLIICAGAVKEMRAAERGNSSIILKS